MTLRRFWILVAGVCAALAFSVEASGEDSPQPNPNPAPTEFECREYGSHFYPFDLKRNRPVGVAGRAYKSKERCEHAIDVAVSANKKVMCAWNRVGGFSPFNLETNIVVGQSDVAYVYAEDCHATIPKAANGMLCGYNGNSWVPYEIETSRPQCYDKVSGFYDFRTCVDEIRESRNNVMCTWNGWSWQPYSRTYGRLIGIAGYGFHDLYYCRETVRRSTSRAVCNWDGYGFRPYHIASNYPIGRYTWATLRDCYASVR